jgi:hypothetical protein
MVISRSCSETGGGHVSKSTGAAGTVCVGRYCEAIVHAEETGGDEGCSIFVSKGWWLAWEGVVRENREGKQTCTDDQTLGSQSLY